MNLGFKKRCDGISPIRIILIWNCGGSHADSYVPFLSLGVSSLNVPTSLFIVLEVVPSWSICYTNFSISF
jgi:hypothetical protein